MSDRQRLTFWLLFILAVLLTALWIIATVMSTPANAHCYSVWRYPWPQRCGYHTAQTETPTPPKRLDYYEDVDIPLPSLEDMEFPPDCLADWCERLKGIGLLRQKLGTN